MADQITNFVVLTRTQNGAVSRPHAPNSEEYTYVASAVNIALGMLSHPTSRHHLAELALKFDNSDFNAGLHFRGNYDSAAAAVDLFLNKIRSHFPLITIDYTIASTNELGYHPRGRWEGQLRDFNPRDQAVFINAARVDDMIAANRSNQTAVRRRFCEFQFIFATTFVHEVGAHLLITFLSNGRPTTPREISAPGYGNPARGLGESGRYLELHLFGGTTEYYADSRQDRHQPGLPHQIDEHDRAWRIDPSVITSACQYQFRFPFTRSGPAVNPTTMRTVGRTFDGPSSSSGPSTNPLVRNMTARQPFRPSARDLVGYFVRVRDLMAIPMHPERRLVAVS